jgi:hypothetical protein
LTSNFSVMKSMGRQNKEPLWVPCLDGLKNVAILA